MEKLEQSFMRDLYNAPPNGLNSDWFEKKYKMSFGNVGKEMQKLVDLGWATRQVISTTEFRSKLTPLGNHNWETVYFPESFK